MSGRQCLVVGGGVAGIEAAAALRAKDPSARIAVLTDEDWPYYARIRLGEVVDGRSAPEALFLRLDSWWDEQRIDLRRGTRVDGVDVAAARVRTAAGEALPYDALLLATGARPFVPPFPGADLPPVVTLRRMDDAVALKARVAHGGRFVVVGGGLLGLELSASLAAAGRPVTVVEAASWLMPRQLHPAGGALLQELLKRRGVAFRLGSGVESVAPGPGAAVRVSLAGGEALEADLVPVSAGVRPDTALAREAGIAVGKGVTIDDGMRTSASGVWAAGDCAEHRSGPYGFWSACGEQGKAAGSNIAGVDVSYLGSVRQTTLKVADVGVFCIGDLSRPAEREEVVREGDSCRCIRMDAEGRVTGAVLVGSLDLRKALTVAALTGRPFRPA